MTGQGRAVEPLAPGDPLEVGPYILEGRLGRGGQARVYLGRTPSGDAVAVKVFDPAWLADPDARTQVAAEISALREVPGFGISRLLDAAADARPAYLVSEYVAGPNLEQAVRSRGPLRGPDLDRFALATLTALRAIHRADVVHRDLKPANVVLGPDGPRIVDFGISVRRGAVEDPSDGVLGTRAYIAPELLDGGVVGPASDVFGWAVTVAFAASGRVPIGPDDELAELPEGLRGVLRRCLDRDPAARPDAVEAMDLVLGAARSSADDPEPEPVFSPAPEPAPVPVMPAAATGSADGSTGAVPAWGTAPPPLPAPLPSPAIPTAPKPRSPVGPPVHWSAHGPGSRSGLRSRRRPPWWVAIPVVALVAIGMSNGSTDDGVVTEAQPFGVEQPAVPDVGAAGVAVPDYPPPADSLPRTDEKVGVLVVPASLLADDAPGRMPMALSRNGSTVTLSSGCELTTWSTTTSRKVASVPVPQAHGGCSAALSPDGGYLLLIDTDASGQTTLTVTDRTTRTPPRSTTLAGPVGRVEFSADGRTVAIGFQAGGMVVWDLVGHRPIAELGGIAPSGDGHDWAVNGSLTTVVGTTDDSGDSVRVWSTGTAPVSQDPMETESWSGRALAISPDGERLAIVRPDDSIGVWSLTTRRPIATLAAAGGHPDALAFSADGRYLAGVGPSGGHLWDTVPGVPVGPTLTDGAGLEGAQVYDLRFSADGSRLLARGSNDAVVAWTVTDKGLTGPST